MFPQGAGRGSTLCPCNLRLRPGGGQTLYMTLHFSRGIHTGLVYYVVQDRVKLLGPSPGPQGVAYRLHARTSQSADRSTMPATARIN